MTTIKDMNHQRRRQASIANVKHSAKEPTPLISPSWKVLTAWR